MLTTEERDKKLVEENTQLLERWMNKMNEEAEKMNEATMFYETYVFEIYIYKEYTTFKKIYIALWNKQKRKSN